MATLIMPANHTISKLLLLIHISLWPAISHSQNIGIVAIRTDTKVETGTNQQTLINPATPHAGVSYNAFSSFNVDHNGAVFVNRTANARTIVAEVFSAAPSLIEGPVTVDGNRANLILANQTGIRVDGGSFVNFGSVALTTGALSLHDETSGSGTLARNVKSTTTTGHIEIGAGGLSADLIHLDLIAKSLAIGGSISNAYTSPTAVARIIAGDSTAVFDTLVSPTDNLTPWVYYTPGNASTKEIAVDINAGSTVTAGRIEIVVTDRGAGVRNAGELLASAGDFSLTSTGLIEQRGGRIQAAGNVRLATDSFQQSSRDDQTSEVLAGWNLTIDATDGISNVSGQLTGNVRDPSRAESVAAVSLKAGGNITLGSDIGGKPGIIFGSNDDVAINTGGDFVNRNGRVISNKSLYIEAVGEARNESIHIGGDPDHGGIQQTWSHGGSAITRLIYRRDGYSVDQGQLADPANLAYWVGDTDVTVKARVVTNLGGIINATQGDVRLDASEQLRNAAWGIGEFRFNRTCLLFLCHVTASADDRLIGGQINAGRDIELHAGTEIINDSGQVLAIGNMTLDAPRTLANGSAVHTVLTRASGMKAMFGDTWAKLYATDQGGGFTAQQGRIELSGHGIQNRGFFTAQQGVSGEIEVIQTPQRTPVSIEEHLGLGSWLKR